MGPRLLETSLFSGEDHLNILKLECSPAFSLSSDQVLVSITLECSFLKESLPEIAGHGV